MAKKEKVAQHYERKALARVGNILGKGVERDPGIGFKIRQYEIEKLHSDPQAKEVGKFFRKSADLYLKSGAYQKARVNYMSAIETYSGNNPRQDTLDEAQFRKYCASKSEEAKKLQHEKESNLKERLEDGHFLAHSSNAMRRHIEFLIAVIGLIVGIFFLSSNITGNVIGNQTISNWVGIVLLVVGLIAGFFWLKSKRK